MTNSKRSFTSSFAFRGVVLAVAVLAACGYSHAQLRDKLKGKGKGNAEPVFEIEGTAPGKPSELDIHDKYVGKIVFSDQRLTQENTKEELFKTSFTLGEPIYARVFTSNAVENYMLYDQRRGGVATENMRNSYTIYYFIDSVEIMAWDRFNTGGLQGVNTWQRFVMDTTLTEYYDWRGDRQREFLNKLSPGLHKVRVEIWAGEGRDLQSVRPLAEGEFDLTVSDGAKLKIGTSWKTIKAGDMDADQKIKTKLTGYYAEEMKKKVPGVVVKDYKIISDDYSVQKDDYGLPKLRSVKIAALGTDSNTGKCYVFYYLYAQDYMGGGNYSGNFYNWSTSPDKKEIDCD